MFPDSVPSFLVSMLRIFTCIDMYWNFAYKKACICRLKVSSSWAASQNIDEVCTLCKWQFLATLPIGQGSSPREPKSGSKYPQKLRNATCTQNLWSVSERPFEFSNDCYLSHSPTLMSTIQHNYLIFPEQTPLASLGPIVPGLHSSRVKPRHPPWAFFWLSAIHSIRRFSDVPRVHLFATRRALDIADLLKHPPLHQT